MMKLVNMLVSKTSAERLVGSSPTLGTKGECSSGGRAATNCQCGWVRIPSFSPKIVSNNGNVAEPGLLQQS